VRRPNNEDAQCSAREYLLGTRPNNSHHNHPQPARFTYQACRLQAKEMCEIFHTC
jgi:hypothetical protein